MASEATREHHQAAREVTQKTIVLLKNSKNLLPIDKAKNQIHCRNRPACQGGAVGLVQRNASIYRFTARRH